MQHTPYVFRKVLDFDILLQNILNQSDCIIFQISVLKKQLSYEAIFLRFDIHRANQLVKSFCLVLVMYAQHCLDQSDSKILKIVVTQEKCEYFLHIDMYPDELKINVVFSRLY